jgi:hypothetical protein
LIVTKQREHPYSKRKKREGEETCFGFELVEGEIESGNEGLGQGLEERFEDRLEGNTTKLKNEEREKTEEGGRTTMSKCKKGKETRKRRIKMKRRRRKNRTKTNRVALKIEVDQLRLIQHSGQRREARADLVVSQIQVSDVGLRKDFSKELDRGGIDGTRHQIQTTQPLVLQDRDPNRGK